MEFRKMLMITLYAEQKKRRRFIEQSFRLCGRRRGRDVSREQHSSILAWRISWTEEPGRLQSMQSQELDMTQRLFYYYYYIAGENL